MPTKQEIALQLARLYGLHEADTTKFVFVQTLINLVDAQESFRDITRGLAMRADNAALLTSMNDIISKFRKPELEELLQALDRSLIKTQGEIREKLNLLNLRGEN